VTCRIYWFTY